MIFFLKSVWITILAIILILIAMTCVEDLIIRTQPQGDEIPSSKLAYVR